MSKFKSNLKNRQNKPPIKPKATTTVSTPKWLKMELFLTILYVFVLLLTFVKTYEFVYDKKLHLGGDNVAYYILGKSIAEGKGYTNIHMEGTPAANHFPPGYSAIVAGIMKVFNSDFQTIKRANGIFYFLSLLILFALFKKIGNNIHLAFIVCILLILNFHLLQYSFIMMSEIPFLLFSCIVIWLYSKLNSSQNPLKSIHFYLFVFTLGFSYYIRTAGIALVGGIMLAMILERNWKYLAATALGFILMVLPWSIRGSQLGGNNYVKQLFMINPYRPEEGILAIGDWFTRFFVNFKRYLTREIPSSVTGDNFTAYKEDIVLNEYLFGGLLILLIGFGIWKLKRLRTLVIGYLLGTFFILLLWPDVWFGTRFMIPVIPFVVFLSIYGVYALITLVLEKVSFKNENILVAVVPFAFLALIPMYKTNVTYLNSQVKGIHHLKYQNYNSIGEWMKNNTPEDAVVSCRKPEIFYLYAHRKTSDYLNSLNTQDALEHLESRNVTYVVLDQLGFTSTSRYLFPLIKKHPYKFQTVHSVGIANDENNPITYLLKFHPECKYVGDLKDSTYKHGYGKLNSYDGSVYEGNWVMDTIQGFGKMTYQGDNYYEGQWVNGVRKGNGKFYWSNGVWFEGEWNNVRNGKGKLFYNDGKTMFGTWVNDKNHGAAEIFNSKGKLVEKHFYDNGNLVRSEQF